MRRRITACLGALLMIAGVTTLARSGEPDAPSFRPAVVADGMTFPVARSNWYSVINFTNDWHDPRMRLIDGKWRLVGVHEGTDVFAEPGTPIRAILGGRVEQMGWTFYSGWRVGIRGTDGRYWFYAHMRRFAPGLEVGDAVVTGQVVGRVGNTGYGNRPGHDDEFTYHLHLGIQESNGTWTNPYPLLRNLYRTAVEGTR